MTTLATHLAVLLVVFSGPMTFACVGVWMFRNYEGSWR